MMSKKVMKDYEVNIMYDHYKDSVDRQKKSENKRDKLFKLIIIIITIFILMTFYPNSIYTNLREILSNNLGVNITFELVIVDFLFWYLIIYLLISYYQLNANIEKNYLYIHLLEDEISQNTNINIYREGRNYLKNYPLFLNISYYFYKFIFPILINLILGIKLIINIKSCIFILGFIELMLYIVIFILNLSYISFNYKLRKKEKNE